MSINLESVLQEYKLSSSLHPLGTDKSTTHSYIKNFYQGLFECISHPRSILEIGVWRGASLALWKKAFPEAIVKGIDINIGDLHPVARSLVDEKLILLTQADAYSNEIIKLDDSKFDLIIDDGPHSLESQISALGFINKLTPIGTLVIEDIQEGIIDIRKLREALPSHLRVKSEFINFSNKSRRYDDCIFVYSNSDSVLDYVREMREKVRHWGLTSSAHHKAFSLYLRAANKLSSKIGKKL